MKVLNIHGYHGSAENSAYFVLKNIGCEVISPALDYDSETPDKILEKLYSIITENKPDAITGTSYGGFFAVLLSVRSNLPVMLVNPCLMPFIYLPRLGYEQNIKDFFPLFSMLSDIDISKVSTIIGGNDEIIDTHDFTKKLLYNDRFVVFPEGRHSGATLPLNEFFTDMLKNI